jgi:hypothetical protein
MIDGQSRCSARELICAHSSFKMIGLERDGIRFVDILNLPSSLRVLELQNLADGDADRSTVGRQLFGGSV